MRVLLRLKEPFILLSQQPTIRGERYRGAHVRGQPGLIPSLTCFGPVLDI